jgi:hypothetical protein
MATKCGTPFILKEWQAAAECGATQMKRLLLKRRTQIEQDQRAVTVMARWLAGKQVRERYRAQGVKVDYIDPVELAKATNTYLEEHRYRLRIEAELILFKICNK